MLEPRSELRNEGPGPRVRAWLFQRCWARRAILSVMPVATLLLTGSCLSTAQQEVVPPLRVESRLVMVGFYAVSHGRVVLNLKPEDVRVFEDGVEQTIAVFEPPSPVRVDRARLPIHISILLDVSGTVVGGGLFDAQLLQRAILAVLKDRVVISLYSFAKECKQLCPPTRELGVLEAALSAAARQKHDGTSLYHSIVQVAQEVQGSRQAAQDVLIVIPDGLSDGDHSTAEQAADAASRAGMRIYPVLLRHTARNHSGDEARDLAMQRSHEMRLLEFTGLGRITGGRSFDLDRLSPERRSENMRRIRSKDSDPELLVRRLVHGMGFRYRLHNQSLPGRPDLVFSGRRKIIFVHGCYWHFHERCAIAHVPKSNLAYWGQKLERNKRRDADNVRRLKALGWRVLTFWECQLGKRQALQRGLQRFLGEYHPATPGGLKRLPLGAPMYFGNSRTE